MAIDIRETFQLDAPVERVWRFLLDPQQVVTCMPGAGLDEVVDERAFLGTIRVKVGPIVTTYKGRVEFVRVDDAVYSIDMVAEGRETGGGSGNARATMTSRLTPLPGGGTEVVTEARAEITGRVMQFGQGMIQGVSHELFKDFVARTRERVNAQPGHAPEPTSGQPAEPVRIVPLLFRTLWSGLNALLRRLFRRGRATEA
jgi:carbon monoxide dehydrogenase subunit G